MVSLPRSRSSSVIRVRCETPAYTPACTPARFRVDGSGLGCYGANVKQEVLAALGSGFGPVHVDVIDRVNQPGTFEVHVYSAYVHEAGLKLVVTTTVDYCRPFGAFGHIYYHEIEPVKIDKLVVGAKIFHASGTDITHKFFPWIVTDVGMYVRTQYKDGNGLDHGINFVSELSGHWTFYIESTVIDHNKFPHKCPRCGSCAYVGFLQVEHPRGMGVNCV